jgi:hypothetical protein
VRSGEEQAGLMAANGGAVLAARLGSTARARTGSRIRLALDPRLCYFFDPETGDSLVERRPVEMESPALVALEQG